MEGCFGEESQRFRAVADVDVVGLAMQWLGGMSLLGKELGDAMESTGVDCQACKR